MRIEHDDDTVGVFEQSVHLRIGERTWDLNDGRRVYLLGAGKACNAMAMAIDHVLGDRLTAGIAIVKIAEDEDWSIIMRHVAANLDESVHRLNEALIDHLVLGMSSQSFMGGVEGSFALLDHLRKVSGVDVSQGAQASEAALHEVGARRIALVTPYYPVIEKNAVAYFEGRGFDVVGVEGLKCRSIIEVASQTEDRLREAVRVADSHRPDAIIQLGTNLRFGRLAPVLEEELGKPVWAVGTVIYWHALRAMGIGDQFDGFGALIAKH